MKNKYRLLTSFAIGLVLSLSLVDAISLSSPSNVDLNENFNLVISDSDSGFYILEINIPSSFEIILDPSFGERIGGVYKTGALGDLTIVLRGVQEGTYTLSGIHGNGFETGDLNNQTIKVNEIKADLSCPVCTPSSLVWSNCEDNKQIKFVYECSLVTDYQCVKSVVTRLCNIDVSQGGGITNVQTEICDVGWICKDDNNLAYQSSDCSLSSIQGCSEGCENAECKVKLGIKAQFPDDNLNIEIKPASTKETPESFFSKIGDLIRSIIEFLMFWNEK